MLKSGQNLRNYFIYLVNISQIYNKIEVHHLAPLRPCPYKHRWFSKSSFSLHLGLLSTRKNKHTKIGLHTQSGAEDTTPTLTCSVVKIVLK